MPAAAEAVGLAVAVFTLSAAVNVILLVVARFTGTQSVASASMLTWTFKLAKTSVTGLLRNGARR